MPRILNGVKVLEHGTYITGPAAGMMLADMGADVVKIEQPVTGDPFRAFKGGLYSPHYQTYGRNKRSVTIDTKQKDELEALYELVRHADIYIQNFRPGVAEKLGVSFKQLQAINPKLIYCAITGFGSSGPYVNRPCYDTVAQSISGFLKLLINPKNPRVTGPAIADSITGMLAAYGIVGALYERTQTGQGKLVEISMMEAMAYFNLDAFTHFFSEGEVMGPYSRPQVSQSYVLECSDGLWISLHMSSPQKFWDGLASAMERTDILQDPRFSDRTGRIENQDALNDILADVFATRARSEWIQRLDNESVPFAPLYDTSEVVSDPQAQHIGLFVEGDHPTMGHFKTVRFPLSFNGEHDISVTPPPTLGQHNDEVLGKITKE